MRIIIADDHAMRCKGLRQKLQEEFPSAEILETADSVDLLSRVRKEHWDLVIADISTPGRGGPEVVQQIRLQFPKLPVVTTGVHPEEVVKAVHKVLLGKKPMEKPPHESLSRREYEVFKLLAAGRSVSEIGMKLLLSSTTISTYRTRVMAKMNMKTNAELTTYAVENNLLDKR